MLKYASTLDIVKEHDGAVAIHHYFMQWTNHKYRRLNMTIESSFLTTYTKELYFNNKWRF